MASARRPCRNALTPEFKRLAALSIPSASVVRKLMTGTCARERSGTCGTWPVSALAIAGAG